MRIFRAFAIRGPRSIRCLGSIVLAGLPLARAPRVLTEEDNMAFYEHVLIARPEISPQQVDTLIEDLTKTIKELGGHTTKTEYWGLRNLTYRINKNRKGHYVLFNIEAPAGAIAEVERNMRLNEDVLRYLTVRVDELEAGPSAMLQSKGRDREGREGGRGDREGGREGGRSFGGGRDRDDRLRPGREGGRDGAPREGGFGGRDRGERPAAVAAEGDIALCNWLELGGVLGPELFSGYHRAVQARTAKMQKLAVPMFRQVDLEFDVGRGRINRFYSAGQLAKGTDFRIVHKRGGFHDGARGRKADCRLWYSGAGQRRAVEC